MPDLRARARSALAVRLRELLAPDALHPEGTHARELAGALVPTLVPEDVAWARAQLAARAKGELRPTTAGTVPAHAAWSSTAAVCSLFAPWRIRPRALPLADLGPFDAVRLEERLAIPHGGGSPNLDVALDRAGGALVGVEAKLTEHLAAQRPRPWRPAYHRPAMAAALEPPWAAVFADLLHGRWTPRHLDAGQLVRHALSLRRAHDLVYLYWEPEGDHPELDAHRAEVGVLLDRVAGAAPRLHALSHDELLGSWARAAPEHVAALRLRYAVRVE